MSTFTINLVDVDCFKCGIVFGMPEQFEREKRERGGTFYCPNGHGQHYTKSEVQRLQEKLETERRSTEFWRNQNTLAERRISAQKGQATKLRKRLANGVCPCCHRHFTNLERHIQGQHPDYVTTEPQESCT